LTLTEKDFRKSSKNGGDGGTGVYICEETDSWMMAADRPYGEFYDFYSVSPEYFLYHKKHKPGNQNRHILKRGMDL
jgi:hypothetical protein